MHYFPRKNELDETAFGRAGLAIKPDATFVYSLRVADPTQNTALGTQGRPFDAMRMLVSRSCVIILPPIATGRCGTFLSRAGTST